MYGYLIPGDGLLPWGRRENDGTSNRATSGPGTNALTGPSPPSELEYSYKTRCLLLTTNRVNSLTRTESQKEAKRAQVFLQFLGSVSSLSLVFGRQGLVVI